MSALPEPGLTEDPGPCVIPEAGFCVECFAGVSSVQTRLRKAVVTPAWGAVQGTVLGRAGRWCPSHGARPLALDPGRGQAAWNVQRSSSSRASQLKRMDGPCLRPKTKAPCCPPLPDPGLQPGVASTHPRRRRMRRLTGSRKEGQRWLPLVLCAGHGPPAGTAGREGGEAQLLSGRGWTRRQKALGAAHCLSQKQPQAGAAAGSCALGYLPGQGLGLPDTDESGQKLRLPPSQGAESGPQSGRWEGGLAGRWTV